MVELSTESYVQGHYVYNERVTLSGTCVHAHAYTLINAVNMEGRYAAAVVLIRNAGSLLLCRRGTLTIVDSTLTLFLTDETELESWTRAQTHFCRGHDSVIWRWFSKSANPSNLIPRQIFRLYDITIIS